MQKGVTCWTATVPARKVTCFRKTLKHEKQDEQNEQNR